jgi:peroxiredoxin
LNSLLIGLVLATASASAIEVPVGTELQYTGSLSQKTKAGATEAKSFSVYALTITGEDGAARLAWSLDERGGGGWAWPERFGLLAPGSSDKTTTRPIRLLHSHEGTQYPLPLRSPVFEFQDKLAADASWTDGRYEYLVTRKRKVKDRDCWQIEVASNIGRAQTIVVEAATGLLVSLDEKVFMGRGDEFQLKLELQSQKTPPADELNKSRAAFDSLREMQSSLGRTGEQKIVELTAAQLKAAQTAIGNIEKQADGTPWAKLSGVIARDLTQQQQRLEGVAGLEKKFVGQTAPKLTLKLANGIAIPEADFQGKVVVLHFWEYRGDPLSEPYGQVGYLDFLNNKRKKLGVKVVGIDVDPRFAETDKAGAAARSLKKLQEFMNLGYDVAIDDGAMLTQFGDPRSLGSPLPLWVVIGHDGKVAHYHIGFYEIRPDEGLKQLDEAVIEALRKQKAK